MVNVETGSKLLLEYWNIEKGLIGSCVVAVNLGVNLLEVVALSSE